MELTANDLQKIGEVFKQVDKGEVIFTVGTNKNILYPTITIKPKPIELEALDKSVK
jgi:hypothetical protein